MPNNPELCIRNAKNISAENQANEKLRSFKRGIFILPESVIMDELRKYVELIDIMGIT